MSPGKRFDPILASLSAASRQTSWRGPHTFIRRSSPPEGRIRSAVTLVLGYLAVPKRYQPCVLLRASTSTASGNGRRGCRFRPASSTSHHETAGPSVKIRGSRAVWAARWPHTEVDRPWTTLRT